MKQNYQIILNAHVKAFIKMEIILKFKCIEFLMEEDYLEWSRGQVFIIGF